jgi:hypothetical protein
MFEAVGLSTGLFRNPLRAKGRNPLWKFLSMRERDASQG